ncbi:MAG: hypothetical protein LBQ90_10260, partial [Synergistaceae bacterium]|nr:hypothetical protein [Synergistaceae bacterium]
ILQIDKKDIDPKVREVWKVQFRPMDEVVREIYIRDAKEEGKIEVARKMLAKGIPVETIEECTGFDEGYIQDLS